ncbi:MAG: CRTAC1 family protein [Fuerstiella sp.]
MTSTYRNGRESENYSILESLGGGTGAFDFDRDGQADLFFAGGGEFVNQQVKGLSTHIFRNLNGTKFTDVSEVSHIAAPETFTQACSMSDYDCDGFPDVLLTGYSGLQLFRNLGDGTFAEVHETALLLDKTWSSSAAWGDLNHDSWPDLYLAHYVNWSFENNPVCPSPWPKHEKDVCPPRAFEALKDIVYYSRGDGTFYDASEEAGLRKDGKGLGVILADLDHDLDLDIYVANDMVDNFLYKNDGKGHFTEDALVSGTATDFEGRPNGSMGLALCDYNGDLTPDLWVTNFEQESFALYKNDGNANFVHASREAGITAIGQLFVGFGTVMGDLDCDGDEDAVISNGHVVYYPTVAKLRQLPLLLQNSGDGRFAAVTAPPQNYFSSPHLGRGLAMADWNNDGLLDLVAAHNNEPAAVLLNSSVSNYPWVRIQLVGTQSPRDAIGARVVLHSSSKNQLRQVVGGGSFQSQNDLTVHFGVSIDTQVVRATVYWPSGIQQSVETLNLRQTNVVVEK